MNEIEKFGRYLTNDLINGDFFAYVCFIAIFLVAFQIIGWSYIFFEQMLKSTRSSD